MKKSSFRYLLITLAVAIAGCELEPPRNYGSPCTNFSFIWTDGNQTVVRSPDVPAEYALNFQTDMCPANAPFCTKLLADRIGDNIYPEELFCSDRRESCPPNSHPSAEGCERDSANHCGDTNVNCLDINKGVDKAECIDGPRGKECSTIKCLDTFALLDSQCKRGDECCGSYCNDCSRHVPQQVCYSLDAINMECGDGCPDDANLECNGVCINPDTNVVFCGSDDSCALHYCAADDGWRNGSCIKGKCEASDCLFGYHLGKDNGRSICIPDTPEACGKSRLNCRDEIAHSTQVDCVLGRCVAKECEAGYNAYNNACIETQETKCGSVSCGLHQVCNTETYICECEQGYTDCGGQCYDLTSSALHCGSCTNECRMAYADSSCANSQCVYNCQKGYTFNEEIGACESLRTCEPGKFDCNNNGLLCCECAGACDTNKCDNSVCEPLVPCREPTACATECCIENMCVAKSQCGTPCESDTHPYGNDCEPDDNENCGEHGNSCNVENADNACIGGICSFECFDNFHAFDNACEPDDNNNCGTHGHACDVADANNVCNAGKCEFTCVSGFVKTSDGSGCEASVCTSGDTSCSTQGSTGFYRTCSDNGWSEAVECEDGNSCKDEDTCGDCINGSKICSDSTHYQVCSTGSWDAEVACEAPTNGSAICDEGICDFTCDDGFTSDGTNCIENNGYCANNNATRCVNDGTTGKIQICSNHEWTEQSTCDSNHSCNSEGTGCGECIEGAKQCSGRTPQTCNHGSWSGSTECTANRICNNGSCVFCPIFQHVYDNECEDNDNTNCGEHGKACTTSSVSNSTAVDCSTGICSATECKSFFTTNGRACCNTRLLGGELIIDNSSSCNYKCSSGFDDCSGICVDLNHNNSNCGECGHSCESGETCSNGNCIGCGTDQLYCNGLCVNYNTDNNNCGECGKSCDTANGYVCTMGHCVGSVTINNCPDNTYTDCEGDGSLCCPSGVSCDDPKAGIKCANLHPIPNCNTGFHPYNGDCEADSHYNCGSHGNTCTASQQCCQDPNTHISTCVSTGSGPVDTICNVVLEP